MTKKIGVRRLSSPIEEMKDHYDVVVVGSGYGGGITASRMARAGRSVCLLERGEERHPGQYPRKIWEAKRQMQVNGSGTGMFDFHFNKDINVLVGCGLGGTSLINANVSIRPDGRVFEDPCWPPEVSNDAQTLLADGFRHAERMLKPTPYPDKPPWPKLAKLEAHRKSAGAMNQSFSLPAINVTFKELPNGLNEFGVKQGPCTLCGDCVAGCNHGAKNTTLMNYIPDAHNHGAEIFTETRVRYVKRGADGRWIVRFEVLGSNRERFGAALLSLAADVVVLAAGTLGSTEILLRSKEMGLPVSERLGFGFSGNGDVVGFAYDCDERINGVGRGRRKPRPRHATGPCITGVIDMRGGRQLEEGLVIEDGSIPGALGPFLALSFAGLANAEGKPAKRGFGAWVAEGIREVKSFISSPYVGPVSRTQTFLVMSQDDAGGRLYLDDDHLRITWPGVGERPTFQRDNAHLERASKALGGIFLRNPIWTDLFGHSLITVHPLGGCAMARGAEEGVVNHKGQVFGGAGGADVHEGLYVSDGSIIPRSLGVNPLLTISALAERNCALLARDRKWEIDYRLPSAPRPEASTRAKVGIQFTEKMTGYFSTQVRDDYEAAAARGKNDGSTMEFVLTVVSDELDQMLEDPKHEARLYGTVTAPEISPQPLAVSADRFNLFVRAKDELKTRYMRYRMRLHSEEGRVFYFEGRKIIRRGSLLDVWPATSTLFVTVHEGESADGPVFGKGILRIRPVDFARQLTTMEVRNARSIGKRLGALALFGKFFAGVLFQNYGGPLAAALHREEEPLPVKQRPLRAPEPQLHRFRTEDGAELELVRFRGGKKGPLVCAPGFGNSTLVFSFDGIKTNFAEFFAGHGYDVWLFDYRASPALKVSETQFSIDDIALRDWPAAVATVREVTGAKSVQVLAHCMGSMTCFMSLLSGELDGVRQLVSSQLTPYFDAEAMDDFKAGIHLDAIFRLIGAKGLDTTPGKTFGYKVIDELLDFYPMPREWRALGAEGRRIFAIYGHVLKPGNLNQPTADALEKMFGYGNITSFGQILEILRAGRIVDKDGQDVYLPHVERLKFPIAFLHGADNVFFYPRGSEKTYLWLRELNGTELYTRHVIPGYAHLDCFIGKNADRDVFPTALAELEKGN